MTQIPDQAVQDALEAFTNTAKTQDGIRAALTAAAPYLTASVEVGELEWVKDGYKYTFNNGSIGYEITHRSDDTGEHYVLNVSHYGSVYARRNSLEQAKAAAQADYNNRILSALKSKPVDVTAVWDAGFRKGIEASAKITDEFKANNAYGDSPEAMACFTISKEMGQYIRALSHAEPVDQWQDIATAPKDGEPILIWKPDEHRVGEHLMSAYWCDDRDGFVPVGGHHKQGYYSDTAQCNQGYPTHWMPLPAAPTSKGGE